MHRSEKGLGRHQEWLNRWETGKEMRRGLGMEVMVGQGMSSGRAMVKWLEMMGQLNKVEGE